MEMTSSEIIDRLSKEDPESLAELTQLFQTADLVKFAKYSTLINENDANLVSAIDFINRTKVEVPPEQQVIKTELTEEEKQTKKSRTTLKTSITVLAVSSAALFIYIIYCVIDLL